MQQYDVILQILAGSKEMTISQLFNILKFLGISNHYKNQHSFTTNVQKVLNILLREGLVTKSGEGRTGRGIEHSYSITPKGLEYLQTQTDLEIAKTIQMRVI